MGTTKLSKNDEQLSLQKIELQFSILNSSRKFRNRNKFYEFISMNHCEENNKFNLYLKDEVELSKNCSTFIKNEEIVYLK